MLRTHMRSAIRHYCYVMLPQIFMVGLLFMPFVIRSIDPSIRPAHAYEISILIVIVIFRNGVPEWLKNQEANPSQKFLTSFVRGIRLVLFVFSIIVIILLGPLVSNSVAKLIFQ
jgi:uncharacterized membrane protein